MIDFSQPTPVILSEVRQISRLAANSSSIWDRNTRARTACSGCV